MRLRIHIIFLLVSLLSGGSLLSDVNKSFEKRALGILRDDCANCHGLYRMGGLGPPLTPERMKKLPVETIKILIREGVPGKFMPPWKAVLTEKEIAFLALYLQSVPADAPRIKLRTFSAPQLD
ncbi:MAG: cytochrome c [Proteobacteria bacterium]|nr:cytochrome c [Pseudomonadota bacterium]